MAKPMKCKKCGHIDSPGEVNNSVFQNTFVYPDNSPVFPKGQYIFLCRDCFHTLTGKPVNQAIFSI
jgi:hypothetical protein